MKPIVAENQVKLGPARCMQLALTGMSYRMFRSLITIAILALAVAFLVHMLAYGLMGGAVVNDAYQQLRIERQSGEAVTRLTNPDSVPVILSTMTAAREPRRLEEYRRWANTDDATFEAVLASAKDAGRFAAYLESLPAPSYAALVGDDTPASLLERMADTNHFDRFEANVKTLQLNTPLGEWAQMRALATERWPAATRVARSIRAGHAVALKQVRDKFPGRSPRVLFAESPEGLGPALREAGFAITEEQLPLVADFVHRSDDMDAVTAMLAKDEVRQAFARRLRIEKREINSALVFNFIDSSAKAAWLEDVLASNGAPPQLTADRLEVLGEHYRTQARLESAAGVEPPDAGSFMGLPASTLYLIALSFIVCIVGVANAMLMSVTERFTEIATMKCLGAMDRFVMMMFVFEAAIQGVVGGLAGLVLGILLALLRGFAEFGSLMGSAASATGDIVVASLISLVVGVVLATFAAVGPSFVAARLAPMEAMRVD